LLDQATILVVAALDGLDKIQIQIPLEASKESWTSLRVNREYSSTKRVTFCNNL
jgi:hypothetical protein